MIYDEGRLKPETIVVGQRVAWLQLGHFYGPEAHLARVTHLTRTQIVVETFRKIQYRFDRATGRQRGGWNYLLDPSYGPVVKARALGVARRAIGDIETLARTGDTKDVDTATGRLENIRTVIDSALDRMARLLTDQPVEEVDQP